MAAGDIISGFSAAATELIFQPAAGVEIIITTIGAGTNPDAMNASVRLTNAVGNLATVSGHPTSLPGVAATTMTRIGITNTIFMQLSAGAAGLFTAYSGIQVK